MKLELSFISRGIRKPPKLVVRLMMATLVVIGLLATAGLANNYFGNDARTPSRASSVHASQPSSQDAVGVSSAEPVVAALGAPPPQRGPESDDCNATSSSAVQDCTEKIKSGRGSASVYLARAQAYIDQGKYDMALADCDEALRMKPGLIDALLLRGAARQHQGDHQRALNDYTEVLRVAPNDVEALTKRGGVLGAMGKLDDALVDLGRAIDLGMKFPSPTYLEGRKGELPIEVARAYYNRGLIWKIKGDPAKAVEDYFKAIAANPADRNRGLTSNASMAGKSVSEKAEILFKDVQFSPNRHTSDWRQTVVDVIPTRFGDLVLVRMLDEAFPSTILRNGREEDRTAHLLTKIVGVYEVGPTDVVLVGVNAGGSDPEYSLGFLILNFPDKTVAVTEKGFVADSYDSIQTTVHSDGRVVVNFGCRDGRQFAGILKGEKLVVRALTWDDDQMAELECEKAATGGPGVLE